MQMANLVPDKSWAEQRGKLGEGGRDFPFALICGFRPRSSHMAAVLVLGDVAILPSSLPSLSLPPSPPLPPRVAFCFLPSFMRVLKYSLLYYDKDLIPMRKLLAPKSPEMGKVTLQIQDILVRMALFWVHRSN